MLEGCYIQRINRTKTCLLLIRHVLRHDPKVRVHQRFRERIQWKPLFLHQCRLHIAKTYNSHVSYLSPDRSSPSLQLHGPSSRNDAVILNGWQELWTQSEPSNEQVVDTYNILDTACENELLQCETVSHKPYHQSRPVAAGSGEWSSIFIRFLLTWLSSLRDNCWLVHLIFPPKTILV